VPSPPDSEVDGAPTIAMTVRYLKFAPEANLVMAAVLGEGEAEIRGQGRQRGPET
jgi:hypothetical protein